MNGWTKKSTNERDKRYDNKVGKKKKKDSGRCCWRGTSGFLQNLLQDFHY